MESPSVWWKLYKNLYKKITQNLEKKNNEFRKKNNAKPRKKIIINNDKCRKKIGKVWKIGAPP
jgi:hypothetical protein